MSRLSGKPKFWFLIVIASCTQCIPSFAQQSDIPRTERDLIEALSKTQNSTPNEITKVLDANATLVTANLWEQLFTSAAREYYQDPERAFVLYEFARVVAFRLNDQKLLGKTYYNIARSHSGLRNFESSKVAYLQSQESFTKAGSPRDLIYILSDLATISLIQERYEEARSYSKRCLMLAESLRDDPAPPGAWPDAFGESGALRILAELSVREGDLGLAIAQLQRALNLINELNDAATYGYYLTETYASLGRVYTSAGDHHQALALLTSALQTAKGPQIPNVINSIGYLYLEQEDYSKAKMQFERSLEIYHSEKNLREGAKVLLNLGVVEQRQGNYDEALRLFNQSLKAATATQLVDIRIAAGEGIGVVLTGKKRFDAALQALNKSLAIAVEIKDKMRQTELLWRTTQTYYEMEDYRKAAAIGENALALARDAHLPKLTYLTFGNAGRSIRSSKQIRSRHPNSN